MEDAYWSRRLAAAFSVANPDLDTRAAIVGAYCAAADAESIPQWVKDWAAEALTQDQT